MIKKIFRFKGEKPYNLVDRPSTRAINISLTGEEVYFFEKFVGVPAHRYPKAAKKLASFLIDHDKTGEIDVSTAFIIERCQPLLGDDLVEIPNIYGKKKFHLQRFIGSIAEKPTGLEKCLFIVAECPRIA